MPRVTLEPAGPDRRETLANLFQLYVHDFSEHWAGTDRGALAEDGRFEPYPYLDTYWEEAEREVFLIRADGELAGFVLLNAHSHADLSLDHAVAEFFVVRKHRRGGVGRAAALAAIRPRPGQWEMAVARANVGAQAFWRGVAGEAALPGTVEELDRSDDLWNGLVIRFRVEPAAP